MGSLRALAMLAVAVVLGVGMSLACVAVAPQGTRPTPSVTLAQAPAVPPYDAPGKPVLTTARLGGPIPAGHRLSIPRLDIDLPITEGDIQRDVVDQRTPEDAAFHLPGTVLPGEPGNSYLYAHARQGMFLTLWDARVGDLVFITTPQGAVLAYVVTEIRPRVPPGDVSPAQPTATERLTLQTSTGPSALDPRFVVFANPVGWMDDEGWR